MNRLPPRETYLPFGRPSFGRTEISAVTRVLRSGWIGMGAEVIAFERELATFVGSPHIVTVSSCTAALQLALLVSGVEAGDEVIVPSLTWCSTANAALYLGARPVLCDVDAQTLCATSESITKILSPRTKAVVVVHFGGLGVDVRTLRKKLPARIAIIEDAAHALGATYPDGTPVGSSGNLVCFSFYANKNLSTAEGGAIALPQRRQADRLRSLRQHGLAVDAWKRFTHPHVMPKSDLRELGYKMNYTDLQAALGRVQLRRQAAFDAHRLKIARIYARQLGPLGMEFQTGSLESGHARHLLAVQLPAERNRMTRDQVVMALRERNIGATIHYQPLHHMAFYRKNRRVPLPVTDRLATRLFTLPISASMTLSDARNAAAHVSALLS